MVGVQQKRRRACKCCHERRVRCDAFEQHPCTNCAFYNDVCEMAERMPRKKMKLATESSVSPRPSSGQQQQKKRQKQQQEQQQHQQEEEQSSPTSSGHANNSHEATLPNTTVEILPITEQGIARRHGSDAGDEVAVGGDDSAEDDEARDGDRDEDRDECNIASNNEGSRNGGEAGAGKSQSPSTTKGVPYSSYTFGLVEPNDESSVRACDVEGSEMLFTRLATSSEGGPGTVEVSTEATTATTAGSEGFAGSHTIYLGESFNLTFVVDQTTKTGQTKQTHQIPGGHANIGKSDSLSDNKTDNANTIASTTNNMNTKKRLHYPQPTSVGRTPCNMPLLPHDAAVRQQEQQLLQDKGVFHMPDKYVHDGLLAAYFSCFHRAFPILDRPQFLQSLQKPPGGGFSYLLLQAVYFVGSIHCDSSLISAAGFPDRYAAMLTFFQRAKALYDTDYETDCTIVVQSVLLMSWWWGGAVDQKDTWHWLGIATSLAQSKGFHRSTNSSNMCQRDQKTWKRIWWSLYIRDRHIAAGLGRPPRVMDQFCDVEALDLDDFEEPSGVHGDLALHHKYYFIHMSRLAVILGKILNTQYACRPSNTTATDIASVEADLDAWRAALPKEMHYNGLAEYMGKEFWANMLQTAYYGHLILLHRPNFTNAAIREGDGEPVVVRSAGQITRMVEDMLAAGLLRKCQLHVAQSLFAALSVHILGIRRSGPVGRELANQRSRTCMLALSKMQSSWPVAGWIFKLFSPILENLSKQAGAINGTHASNGVNATNGATSVEGHPPLLRDATTRASSPSKDMPRGTPAIFPYPYMNAAAGNTNETATNAANTTAAFGFIDGLPADQQVFTISPSQFADVGDQFAFLYDDLTLDYFAQLPGVWDAS